MVFSRKAAIAPMDGVPTLQMRVGNDRNNQIFDARIRLMLMISTTTAEGMRFYRNSDLKLVREHAPALSRSWSVLHVIDETSPLHGQTPESLQKMEAELTVTVAGVDETSLQSVFGRRVYEASDVAWGARPADVLTDLPNGDLQLDVRKFHDLVATEPQPGFPYPRKAD
jgi:inward rectifier potassium channel